MSTSVYHILNTFAVLKPDLSIQPVNVTPSLYEDLDRNFDDFKGHVLISVHEFDKPWSTWERHPAGDEIVMLLAGRATVIMKTGLGQEVLELSIPGSYVLIPQGIWHRAETSETTRVLFITPGEGTENCSST